MPTIAGPATGPAIRVVVERSSAHYFLDLYLLFSGVDPNRVALVALAPEQIAAALKDQSVDAVAIWEPFANQSIRALAGDSIVLPSARIYTETFNLLASRKLIAARGDEMAKVLRALQRAQRFIRERPRDAQAILKERLNVDQAFVDAAWTDFDYRMSLDQALVSTLVGQARWALREGHLPRDTAIPNYLDFIAPEPLRRVEPGAVTVLK